MWCRNMFKADRLSQVTKRGCRHRWRAIDSSRRQVCSLLNTGGGPEPQIGPLRNTAAAAAGGEIGSSSTKRHATVEHRHSKEDNRSGSRAHPASCTRGPRLRNEMQQKQKDTAKAHTRQRSPLPKKNVPMAQIHS
jgi:hypothetical protein